MDEKQVEQIGREAARTVTDKCFRTVDVWLDIAADFAVLQGMILAGKDKEYMENALADIGLTASYGYSKGIVSQEEVEVAKYHRERIKKALEGLQPKTTAYKTAKEAITWAGRTFADKVVDCECSEEPSPNPGSGNKEPWQMTREEFRRFYKPSDPQWRVYPFLQLDFRQTHMMLIKQAQAEGKPVPPEVLADYPELALPKTPWMEAGERLRSAADDNPGQRKSKLTKDDVNVGVWEERDRLHIYIDDKKTGDTIAEWWDDDARRMFEDGFFKPGIEHRQLDQVPSREMADSVLSYAEDMGLLIK